MKAFASLLVLASLSLAGCASSAVNMSEPRRVVGTESSVRLDAQISDEVRPGAPLAIQYEITNDRPHAIAVADILPETSWDGETRMVTISIGSEVPGTTMLPRLIRIGPGEKRQFTTTASLARVVPSRSADPRATNSTLLRVRLNFLADTEPFAELIGIPEKAVANARRADELFAAWLEQNEVVYTNAVPVTITSFRPAGEVDASERSAAPLAPRRRRG